MQSEFVITSLYGAVVTLRKLYTANLPELGESVLDQTNPPAWKGFQAEDHRFRYGDAGRKAQFGAFGLLRDVLDLSPRLQCMPNIQKAQAKPCLPCSASRGMCLSRYCPVMPAQEEIIFGLTYAGTASHVERKAESERARYREGELVDI